MLSMNKIITYLYYVLLYGYVILSIFLLVNNITQTNIIITFVSSYLLLGIIIWALKKEGMAKEHLIFMLLACYLNILGESYLYYMDTTFYDKIVHLVVGILITSLIYTFYRRRYKVAKKLILLAYIGIATIWEFYEFFVVTYLNIPFVGVFSGGVLVMDYYTDTIFDLIYSGLGSVVYLIYALLRKR